MVLFNTHLNVQTCKMQKNLLFSNWCWNSKGILSFSQNSMQSCKKKSLIKVSFHMTTTICWYCPALVRGYAILILYSKMAPSGLNLYQLRYVIGEHSKLFLTSLGFLHPTCLSKYINMWNQTSWVSLTKDFWSDSFPIWHLRDYSVDHWFVKKYILGRGTIPLLCCWNIICVCMI